MKKILIIILIILAIVGVYFLKNRPVGSAPQAAGMEAMEYTVWSDGILSSELPLLLDFGSAQCPPCNAMKEDLVAFYEETYGKVRVLYADIWKDPSLTGGLPAQVVPTQYFFLPGGKPYQPGEEISKKILFMQYMYSDSGEHALTGHQGMLTKEEMYEIFRALGVDV